MGLREQIRAFAVVVVVIVNKQTNNMSRLLLVADEGQRRAGEQLFELVGAQDFAAEAGLPYPGAGPGAVQQRGLTRRQAAALGEEAGAVLPVSLLVSNAPKLLPMGRTT